MGLGNHGATSVVACAVLVALAAVACDSSDDGDDSNGVPEAGLGGSAGSGDTGGSGGSAGGSGGTAGSAGSPATGGSSAGSGGDGGNAGNAGSGGAYGGSGGSAGSGGDYPDAGPDGCSNPGALEPPTVPDAQLSPPDGATLVHRLHAEGDQIYRCAGTPAGDAGMTYAWTLKEPSAVLYDDTCTAVGTHYLGPTWEWDADNSTAVGTKLFGATVDASAIQWLLLQVVDKSETGTFSQLTYVQRVDTVGGLAPSNTTCTAANVDDTEAIPYTAYYYLYEGP